MKPVLINPSITNSCFRNSITGQSNAMLLLLSLLLYSLRSFYSFFSLCLKSKSLTTILNIYERRDSHTYKKCYS